MANPRRGGAHLAGLQPRPGLHLVGGVDQLRGLGAGGHGGLPLPGRRRRHRDPAPADRAHARIWHGAVPGIRPGQRYGYRVAGPVGARAGAAVQPAEAAARSVRAGRQWPARAGPGDLRLRRGAPESRTSLDSARQGAAQRGRRRPVRLAATTSRATPVARHRHLRAARQGHDPAARPGARGAPRHVRRPRDPGGHRLPVATSASPRSSCCRCTSSSPSRRSPRAG